MMILRRRRQLSVQLVEHLLEHRNDEHQHEDEDERRERDHDGRVDHRALHAPLQLRLLLDLRRNAVEDGVKRSRRLARRDHRAEEPVEHLRVPRECAREDHSRLDVRADLGDDLLQILVVGLLLERHERGNDADACLDHGRQLASEDLERLRLDLLEHAAEAVLAGGRLLGEAAGQETSGLQLFTRAPDVRRADRCPSVKRPCALIASYANSAMTPRYFFLVLCLAAGFAL